MSVITSGNISLNSVEDMTSNIDNLAESDSGIIENLGDLTDQLYGQDGDINTINSDITNVNESMETYKTYISIDTLKPSITLGKSLNTKLVLESQKLAFYTDGNEAASLANDMLEAPSVKATNIYMQTVDADTGESIGALGLVARSNGHLTIKRIG